MHELTETCNIKFVIMIDNDRDNFLFATIVTCSCFVD